MKRFTRGTRLIALAERDWRRAVRALEEFDPTEPFSLAYQSAVIGLGIPELLAILGALYEDDICELFLLVYHCEEHPIMTRAWSAGMPCAPFACPECERPNIPARELSFDVRAQLVDWVRMG